MGIRAFLLVAACLLFMRATAQVIPPERITDWSDPGCRSAFLPTQSVDILDHGADPTGVNPCNAALQAALAALGGPGEVYFPPGEYRFPQAIVLPDSIVLRGDATADQVPLARLLLAPGENADGIRISGTEQAPVAALVALPVQGDRHIRVDQPSLYAVGDLLRLQATDDSLLVNDWWGVGQTGQIVEVTAITGDSLHVAKPLRRTYTSLPTAHRITPRRQVHLRCLAMERIDATTSQTVNVFFRYALDCSMHGVDSHLANYAHVNTWRSARITIGSCHFKDAHAYNSGGKGYGVLVDFGTCDSYIHRNAFEHLRHSMLLQAGANGNVFAYNRSKDPFWSSFPFPSNAAGDLVLHGNYPYMNLFEGNVVQNIVIDNSHDINGPYNTFFRNRAELYGIFMNNGPASNDQNFIGNQVTNTSSPLLGLYSLQGTGHFAYGNQVKGTIQPVGTQEPAPVTLFAHTFPAFYQIHSAVPPIRTDNWQTADPLIEVHYRWDVLGQSSSCTDSIPLATAIPGLFADPALALSPNPVHDILRITGLHAGELLRVIDACGRTLWTGVATAAQEDIAVDALVPGVYLLHVGTGGCARFVRD